MPRQAKRIKRPLLAADRAKYDELRRRLAEEKPEILAKGRRYRVQERAAQAALCDALRLLRAEREAQGLSLADIEDRTGISRPALSRLENAEEPNPTVGTLTRYAQALGKTVAITLAAISHEPAGEGNR